MNTRNFYRLAAPFLGKNEDELYNIERDLRRDHLIISTRPGPGGGLPASPDVIAAILVAILASDQKRGSGKRAKEFGLLRPMAGDACPLTGARCFGEALATIISSPENALASHVIEVEVVRGLSVATIEYRGDNGELHVSAFGVELEEVPALAVKATLPGGALFEIAVLLQATEEKEAEAE